MGQSAHGVVASVTQQFRAPATWCLWGMVTTILVVAGPFGTYDHLSFGQRAVFWPLLTALSLVIAIPIQVIVKRLKRDWPVLLQDVVTVILFSAIFAPVPVLVGWMILGDAVDEILGYFELFVAILVLSLATLAARCALKPRTRPGLTAAPSPEPKPGHQPDRLSHSVLDAPPPRFLRRLDGVTQGQILRLSVNDHYVNVHLSDGDCRRVLMRFSDAVEELEGLEGLCVHRSHWVARHAVRTAERDGGREVVILVDGSRVPVSRTYRPGLVAAGWIVDHRPAAKAR